ncbi:PREDICTED: trypsin-1-like [Papilio polytes]|uniref:trypsin-1-like n=1 Tax=Papilio polytes TaxID=76194 RepID=UPI000676A78C|nr:PREDICTED: trypsin-1-like [Papilio polytes]
MATAAAAAANYGSDYRVGDKCLSNDNEDGICALITDCPVAINEIRHRNYHKYKRCGFQDDTEIVCCPQKPVDRYGETNPKTTRIADLECKKITDNLLPPLDLHIIGGEIASLGEFPHMVALGYPEGDGYNFMCGATLLSDRFVLTAAHCVDTIDQIKPAIARLGVVELGSAVRNNASDVDIAEIILHPNYTRRFKYHDLSLIRLSRRVEFSSVLSPACLYSSLQDPTAALTVTGWGKTSTTRNVRSNMLLKAKVSIVAREKCNENYSMWRKLPDGIAEEQLCAGDPQGLRDTCQGDSGGPLQALTAADGHFRVVGVTSFGRGCGSPVPGVYTRLARYLDWIESIVWPQD